MYEISNTKIKYGIRKTTFLYSNEIQIFCTHILTKHFNRWKETNSEDLHLTIITDHNYRGLATFKIPQSLLHNNLIYSHRSSSTCCMMSFWNRFKGFTNNSQFFNSDRIEIHLTQDLIPSLL